MKQEKIDHVKYYALWMHGCKLNAPMNNLIGIDHKA